MTTSTTPIHAAGNAIDNARNSSPPVESDLDHAGEMSPRKRVRDSRPVRHRTGRRTLIEGRASFNWANAQGGAVDTPSIAKSARNASRNCWKGAQK